MKFGDAERDGVSEPSRGAGTPLHVSTERSRTGWAYCVWETEMVDGQYLSKRMIASKDQFGSCNAAETAGLARAKALLGAAQLLEQHADVNENDADAGTPVKALV